MERAQQAQVLQGNKGLSWCTLFPWVHHYPTPIKYQTENKPLEAPKGALLMETQEAIKHKIPNIWLDPLKYSHGKNCTAAHPN